MAKYSKYITLGYNSDGNRVRKRAYGNTKIELESNIARLKREYLESIANNHVTFKKYAQTWLNTYKKGTSPRTYDMYDQLLKKCKELDPFEMMEIKRSDIQNLMNDLIDRPNLHNKVLMCLNQVFESAIMDEIVRINPVKGISKQKTIVKEKRALTTNEKRILATINFEPKEQMFIDLLLNFGLRPGEALALTKDDFDFANNTLTISKAITFVTNDPILKGTKTGTVRTLPIPASLVPKTKQYLDESENILFDMQKQGDYGYMTKMAYRIFKNEIFEKINIALGGNNNNDKLNGMTFYTFRHNKATALYYVDGLSLKAKAEYMGHSVSMLLKIYSHIDKEKENSEKYNVI